MKALRLSPKARLAMRGEDQGGGEEEGGEEVQPGQKARQRQRQDDEAEDQDRETGEHALVAGDEATQRRARRSSDVHARSAAA